MSGYKINLTGTVQRLKKYLKGIISRRDIKANGDTMESLRSWKFLVETETEHGVLSFRLSRKNDTTIASPINHSLTNKHRFMKCIFSADRDSNCKDPKFAFDCDNLQKKLKSIGYNTMWTVHGLLSDSDKDVLDIPEVEHTSGRKRKRQPTFTIGDDMESDNEIKEDSTTYQKGILLAVPENNSDSRCEISKLLRTFNFTILVELECTTGDGRWVCQQPESGVKTLYVNKIVQDSVELDTNMMMHPAFMTTSGNMVFHSLDEVMSVLNMCPDMPGFQELQKYASTLHNVHAEHTVNEPFIVIEGLDGTGKSTLVESLVSKLNATQLQTPPAYLQNIRSTFDNYPTLIRRVFYSVGNYLAAKDIVSECTNKAVVMDRFWHSTAAYTIATECTGDLTTLPPAGHPVYSWPEDLVQPSLVILLTINEEVRTERMGSRVKISGEEKTAEEIQLEKNSKFRQRIMQCYKRMDNPNVIEVSADGSKEDVLNSVLQVLKEYDIVN